MKKQRSRRTDIAIIISLFIIAAFIFLSIQMHNSSSDVQTEQRTLESYNGKTLGAKPGSLAEEITAEKFPDSPIAYYTDTPELYTALVTGKIDGFVNSTVVLEQLARQRHEITWFPEVLHTGYRYFGFAKTAKGDKLLAQMNELLAELNADGTMAQMEEIWYGEDDARKVVDHSGLTGENGTLQVGISATDEPYSYYKGTELTGFNIDLVTRFARRYGYTLVYTEANHASLLMGMKTGKYDMLAFAMSYSEERAEAMNFSDPVIHFENHLAVRVGEGPDGGQEITEKQTSWFQSILESFEKTFIRESRWKLIVQGIGTTCLITFLAVLLGTLLAFAICMFRRTGSKLANIISNIYVKILQDMPMVVLLLILYYVIFGSSSLAAVWVAVIGFSLHFGAYVSETLRSGIDSIDPGQQEAAMALGYTENQAFFSFILPQAVTRIIPVYIGQVISLLKGTAVAGYITVQDLTKMSDIIRSRTYEAFFPLISTALIYFLLAWIIRKLLNVTIKRIKPRRNGGKSI